MRFEKTTRDLAGMQSRVLRRILRANEKSRFGRKFGFSKIRSMDDYRRIVPLSLYDDYETAVAEICRGRKHVLTTEKVLRLSPTSGSTSAQKLIPVTASLKKEFQRAIEPWIYDLFSRDPELMDGPAFWSISPLCDIRQTCRIPIGFDSDTSYLSGLLDRFLRGALAVPPAVSHIRDMDSFRYIAMLFLARCRELRLVSVWNPDFFRILLTLYMEERDRFLFDISQGKVSVPGDPKPFDMRVLKRTKAFASLFVPDRQRAFELRSISPMDWQGIWPRLRLISCWMDGPSGQAVELLRRSFPRVPFQGKGLITTEAFVSFPWNGASGCVLAANSHFFEFRETNRIGDWVDPSTVPATEVKPGTYYTIHVTTGGGLYRYRIHDIVHVDGFHRGLPVLRFIGKTDLISDYFGEKLSQGFVTEAWRRLLFPQKSQVLFAMIAPEYFPEGFGYVLFLESRRKDSVRYDHYISQRLDDLLRENYHYRLCRRLGQIRPLRVVRVFDGLTKYHREWIRRGMRAGDIKPTILRPETGWMRVLWP